MLNPRTAVILKSIIDWYIEHAIPVSSQILVKDYELNVSSATVRNEMAYLEQEGYIIRPHTSAGSVPSDKGYRFYVSSIPDLGLPVSEQRMINHLFHQVEGRVDEWLSLAASLISRISQNTAVVTAARPADCQFRHLELMSIQDSLVLFMLVLRGARIKQQLLTMETSLSQEEFSAISNKFNQSFQGMTAAQVKETELELTPIETQIRDILVKIMREEDELGFTQSYLEGLHLMLNQPEFAHHKIPGIMEVLEQRAMLGTIIPKPEKAQPAEKPGVQVVIGSENKAAVAQDCSLVISRYGLPEKASGTIMVVGPTRMAYPRVISAVSYLSALLSTLVAEIYGVDTTGKTRPDNSN